MTGFTLRHGDNLETLRALKASGAKFDLVELDGPYMAGIGEGWDELTETEYIEHYAARLAIVKDILQPWGVVFVFGYPEGCAEIKSWCRRTGVLYLRRWLTWYKQVTAHKGRKVESILFFIRDTPEIKAVISFGEFLKTERDKQGKSLRKVGELAGRDWWHRGGKLYFETGSRGYPSLFDFLDLSRIFDFSPSAFPNVISGNYPGLTDIDYIERTYIENTEQLNGSGLRSKPVGLYLDLFQPILPPTETPRALILYGGSGNAGIAAGALGYEVTICESDPKLAEFIGKRFDKEVSRWKSSSRLRQTRLTSTPEKQTEMFA